MGGWQQQPSTAGVQATISIATGMPSQGFDLLKAQYRSQPTAARTGIRIMGSCLHVTHPLLPSSLCLGDRQESKASQRLNLYPLYVPQGANGCEGGQMLT